MIIILFFLGLSFGSFLLVVVDRLHSGESFVSGRSHCDACKHTLSWYDLIPVLSYILTHGKCRYCKHKLSPLYPVSEIVCGFLFVFAWLFLTTTNTSTIWLPFISMLLIMMSLFVIFFSDLVYGTIPFPVVIVGIISGSIFILYTSPDLFLTHFVSGAAAFIFFLCLYLITRGRGIGFGDVVYGFLMGLFLGFPSIIIGLYLAFLTGAGVSLILVLAGKKKLSGSTISFGPFLVMGTIVAFYYGGPLYRLLLSVLHL